MSFRAAKRNRVVVNFDPNKEPSRTKQSFREECDINVLMARYQKQGVISHVNPRQPVYADVSAALPFQEALHVVHTAQAAFMQLPASVRSRFHNDPARFVEFCQDPANTDELSRLGLLRPQEPNKPGDGGGGGGLTAQPRPLPPGKMKSRRRRVEIDADPVPILLARGLSFVIVVARRFCRVLRRLICRKSILRRMISRMLRRVWTSL